MYARGLLPLADERGYIVVAPMGLNPFGGFGSRGPGRAAGRPDDPENAGALSELDVMHVINLVRREFTIDDRRVFLFGHSMGGAGALYLAGAHPGRWAGMALFAPGSRGDAPPVAALKNVRTIIFQGKDDGQVSVVNTRRMVALMRRLVDAFEYHELVGDHFSIIDWSPQNIRRTYDFFEGVK